MPREGITKAKQAGTASGSTTVSVVPHNRDGRATTDDTPVIRTASTIFRPRNSTAGGWVKVNPAFAAGFAAIGLEAAGFLDLPGEVVSGHPDRHVVRVQLPGFATEFYLKRQHLVRLREKWRNWRTGFGWVSRSEREADILEQLSAAGLPVPRLAAAGVDGYGRAFLLVEEVAGAVDLRQVLHDDTLIATERVELARNLGLTIVAIHDAGFTTPELTAKHILVSPATGKLCLIDWQSSRHIGTVGLWGRFQALAALHASLAEGLATPRERLRVLRAAIASPLAKTCRVVLAETTRIANRRSLRDQRLAPSTAPQRLVWVAGEAVCAIPDVATMWPDPPIAAPFYGEEPGTFAHQLPDGRDAVLIRGRSVAPLGRLCAYLRGRVWRSPGVSLGRLLFHLDRYGIPAPRLLAFGQRLTGAVTADWFALHTPLPEPIAELTDLEIGLQLGFRLRQLHDAGCSVSGNPLTVFGLRDGAVCMHDLTRVRITKPNANSERLRLMAGLSPWMRGGTHRISAGSGR